MVNFLVVTHGDFGAYCVEAAEGIVGEQKHGVTAVSISPRVTLDEARAKVSKALAALSSDGADGVIILTDIPGGTPTNLCLPAAKDKSRTAVLTGLNLYMLVTGFSHRALPFEELKEKMLSNGRNSIVDIQKVFLSRIRPQ